MEYLTLAEYDAFATKLIIKKLGHRFLTDENISHVVYYMANADSRYNPEKGTKRSTYRMIYGLHGIQTLCRLRNKSARRLIQSRLIDIIPTRPESEPLPYSIIEIMDSVKLTRTERKYLLMYLDDKNHPQIAEECGVTKQAVSKIIISAINRMREIYGP